MNIKPRSRTDVESLNRLLKAFKPADSNTISDGNWQLSYIKPSWILVYWIRDGYDMLFNIIYTGQSVDDIMKLKEKYENTSKYTT